MHDPDSVEPLPTQPLLPNLETSGFAFENRASLSGDLSTPPAPTAAAAPEASVSAWKKMGQEIVAGVQTLVSAAVYATLIVTFGVQVARVDGLSMAPTLANQDRLIVNKFAYLPFLGSPR